VGDRKTTLYSGFWSHRRIEEWSAYQKLLFIYLMSNDRCSTSGVYYITRDRIHWETKIPRSVVDENLVTSQMEAVTYDATLNVVFVHGKLRRSMSKGGAKNIIAKTIVGDYYANYKAVSIWRLFRDIYSDQVASMPLLNEVFNEKSNLDGEPGSAPFLLGAELTPHAEDLTSDADREGLIQRELNRYMDLPSDDLERITKVIEHISRRRGGDVLVSPQTRLDRVAAMGKMPVEQIARSAFLFIDAGGIVDKKPWGYFETIMNSDDVRKWYETFEKAQRRKNGIRKQRREDGGEHPSVSG